jgi:hypothetical protein
MSDFFQGEEMSEETLLAHYGSVVEQALAAMAVDNSYATAIALKARSIEARRTRRDHR